MPVSMKSMRMAVSRRSSKVFPEHEANHVRRSPWFTTSTGWSVSCGGDIFAIGDEGNLSFVVEPPGNTAGGIGSGWRSSKV